MRNACKLTISLPLRDYQQIEDYRRRSGKGRSAIVDTAIQFWLRHIHQTVLIKKYEAGYRKKPELPGEMKALEKESGMAVGEEGLQW